VKSNVNLRVESRVEVLATNLQGVCIVVVCVACCYCCCCPKCVTQIHFRANWSCLGAAGKTQMPMIIHLHI